MRIVRTADFDNIAQVKELLQRPRVDQITASPAMLERTKKVFGEPLTPKQAVQRILDDIESDGDQALIRYISAIDNQELLADQLIVSTQEYEEAEQLVSAQFRESLQHAITNVRAFHGKQVENSWFTTEHNGAILGQQVLPLERVGIYVPGGNAPLVSSVVMSAIPANVAGVKEIWMATPLRSGKIDPHLLVAARACGVTGVLKAGGAHGIGALAFGTASVPKVDKIVGPGNIFVTLAKKMVFGIVDIESLAGPSEILVVADHTAPPHYIAADMLSQAEHDWDAAACLITTSESLAQTVQQELDRQLQTLGTKSVAAVSLERWGLVVVARDLDEALELTNVFAPEHLELMVSDPWAAFGKVRNAGAVFLGRYSSEPVGDYVAGPNHILPTNGTARFSSPLTTNDFVKKTSLIYYTADALLEMGPHAVRLAQIEGLDGHANAVRQRLADLGGRETNE